MNKYTQEDDNAIDFGKWLSDSGYHSHGHDLMQHWDDKFDPDPRTISELYNFYKDSSENERVVSNNRFRKYKPLK